ncbi:GAF domain-containing sensor histidine kinase [Phormidium sp. CCY1219]|uniref:GAF domain-containing sensor histidine kinase n=1 Tax=Phormidium sp. CCY1219 TaxID=2886104 RepID=UPI002D1F19BC|nr:GAF domain-containing protein [Phormidium sp. CCY1219]MEB3828922.1 GAF domain-containing protein [Phormidium sp. CCY1219]
MTITNNNSNNGQILQQRLDREVLLHRMLNRIRQSLELPEILSATAAEIRSLLGTDRVMVYQFNADGSGKVIAESIYESRLASLKGLNFPADDIPEKARERFVKDRVRSIVDVGQERIGMSPLARAETGEPVGDDIHYRPVDPCHLTYLRAMGVNSSLVVPILHQQSLWGLIVSHNVEPRAISEDDLQLVQLVADQVSVAIAQATLLEATRAQQAREATINRVATLLHAQPTIEVQAALEATVAALSGCGGRLYIAAKHSTGGDDLDSAWELFTVGEQPTAIASAESQPLEAHPLWQQWLQRELKAHLRLDSKHPAIWPFANLYKTPHFKPFLHAFRSTSIRSMLVVPLFYRRQFLGCLTIFRQAIETETLWAGRFDSNLKQLLPRQSFEAWRERKTGQSREWTVEETQMARSLGDHFSMAIEQYLLYKEVHSLNSNLEQQVQKRTAELQQSLQFTRILKQITDQIRSTLDLTTILQTIVQQVRNLLEADRVVIYQFGKDGLGEIAVEDLRPGWESVLGVRCPGCIPLEYCNMYLKGRVRAINDIATAEISPCHQEFLATIQVKANLIVPIRMGSELWGFLIAHQCDRPRVWQETEIDLLQQLADRAAIAIGQAQLYQQSQAAAAKAQAQAVELEQAVEDLQSAQTQLIQGEKMSSLGQLVAGIAHEINNPVNFIYGNLSHASQYADDLLELQKLYQKYLPDPEPEMRELMEEIDLDFLVEDFPKMLASMKVGAERIRSIVLSLRNFSRLDQAEMKPVNIHDGIDSTLLILHHRLKSKSDRPEIHVVKEYGELPSVDCYAGQLNQVFMNILSNAIDALEQRDKDRSEKERRESPSQITIRTAIASDRAMGEKRAIIRISDNGPGIPERLRSRIFEPFFTTKDIGKGTGMGLSISYQIVVEKHGGQFDCISQPGQGTEFAIEIPVSRRLAPSHRLPKKSSPSQARFMR